MAKFEWILSKCFLILFIVVSVSLFIVVARLELVKDEEAMNKTFESLERMEEKRVESIINS